MEINVGLGASIDAQTVVTGRGCIIGQSGSGKSYLLGVVVEELCKSSLPFVLFDTEGEYLSLKKSYKIIQVGDGEDSDFHYDVDLQRLFHECVSNDIPVIFDLSESADKQQYVQRALTALYSIEDKMRKPFLVVLEEADKFAPQVVHKEHNMVEEICVRGRKRGMGILLTTQRPASISKNVLAQCSYGFIGKLGVESDIKAVSTLIEDRKALASIPKLVTGTFLHFGIPIKVEYVRVKRRELEPEGTTPKVEVVERSNEMFSKALEEIRDTITNMASQVTEEGGSHAYVDADILEYNFTMEDARERAARIAKKLFLLIGPKVEVVDSLEQVYVQSSLCLVMVPTGKKNEYIEHYILLKGDEIVKAKKQISFIRPRAGKPIKLSDNERAFLTALSSEGGLSLPLWEAAERASMSQEAAARCARRLKRANLVKEGNGNYSTENYKWHLLFSKPSTIRVKIDSKKVLNYSPKPPISTVWLLADIFPDCKSSIVGSVYVPVYKITLRRKGKVRVFFIDGIYGKGLNGLEA